VKKKFLFIGVLVLAVFGVYQYVQADIEMKIALAPKFEYFHGVGTVKTPVVYGVVQGDSIYLRDIEYKGTWSTAGGSGSALYPWQAYQWFTNASGDAPFRMLNWTAIVFDTTWVKTVANGTATFTIAAKTLKAVRSATAWTITGGIAATRGWMDTTATYYVDVYGIKTAGGPDTLLRTHNFTGAYGQPKTLPQAEYEVRYSAVGTAADTNATYPTSLTTGETYMRIKFLGGASSLNMPMTGNINALRLVLRNVTKVQIASETLPLSVIPMANTGLQLDATIGNTPVSGYFSANDVVELTINTKDSLGNPIDWTTNPAANSIDRVQIVVSGPRRDYMRITGVERLVYGSVKGTYPTASWSGMPSGTPFANPIKIKLPTDSIAKFGTGTYTAYVYARRVTGWTSQLVKLVDFQVGTLTVDPLNVSSSTLGQSCAQAAPCHGLNGPTGHYGSKGAENCIVCHTDNMGTTPQWAFMRFAHTVHFTSAAYTAPKGDCAVCHINNSANVFTTDANDLCTQCHVKVPRMSASHLTAVPLYAASGLSCATMNCHAGGGVGAFKNNTETHAGLAAKYPGGNVVAKKTGTPIIIDGVEEPIWNLAPSTLTAEGVTVKMAYDDNNIYALFKWADGHREYPLGAIASTNSSLTRRQWTYNGTTWTQTSTDEDRFAISWKKSDTNYGSNCALTCHNTATIHATSVGIMDVWHWKSTRSNSVGLMDDQYFSTTGRKNDSLVSGTFGWENSASGLPTKMGPNAAANNASWLFNSTALPFVNTGFANGDHIPGYIANDVPIPVVGSRGDVLAKALYNDATGVWTLEIKRNRNTGNPDDFVVDLVNGNDFSLAKFDATGSDHPRQGVDMGVYHVTYSTEIIPVELTSFSASTARNNVTLTWQTATEKNNKGFDVQRKINGTWESVGFVNGKGTSAKATDYSYTDKVTKSGNYNYRLKQVDFDGTANYSNEIEVLVQPSEFQLSQNYPNPFNPTTTIDFTVANKGLVKISVFNVAGEEVATIMNEEKESGYYTIQFNASKLSSGVYFYRMASGSFITTKKLVILK